MLMSDFCSRLPVSGWASSDSQRLLPSTTLENTHRFRAKGMLPGTSRPQVCLPHLLKSPIDGTALVAKKLSSNELVRGGLMLYPLATNKISYHLKKRDIRITDRPFKFKEGNAAIYNKDLGHNRNLWHILINTARLTFSNRRQVICIIN